MPEGGFGPLPKPAAQRARRNAYAGVAKLQVEGFLEQPDLPFDEPHPLVAEWWDAIWASPIAKLWDWADVPSLIRLAILWNDFASSSPLTFAWKPSDMVALEDRLGLSPYSRRKLNWEIERVAPKTELELATSVTHLDDVRRRLEGRE